MQITSISFLLFTGLIWVVALAMKTTRSRQALLLVASYLFYASWGVHFVAVLIMSTLGNYFLGILLSKRRNSSTLWWGVGFNLLILLVFKYIPDRHAGSFFMPIGVSFWTFQAISYLIDIYRDEEIEASLLEFSLYLAFWPTILSGPVNRAAEMITQFRNTKKISYEDVSYGTKRIVMGLFMKLVLSNLIAEGFNAGEGLNTGFDQMAMGWSAIDVWFLAIGFGFQLFFDFAGYSHIVIGIARMFGFTMRENFDKPYLSTSPSIFWTRWHMSLSFWIRDYVFLTLATFIRVPWWRFAALFLSMVIFGLWHGATLPFLIWGCYQGSLLVIHRVSQKNLGKITDRLPIIPGKVLSWAVTFMLISIGWIFFRCHSISEAFLMIGTIANSSNYHQLVLRPNYYIVTSAIIIGYFIYAGIKELAEKIEKPGWLRKAPWILSPIGYSIIILLSIIWSTQEQGFLYFSF